MRTSVRSRWSRSGTSELAWLVLGLATGSELVNDRVMGWMHLGSCCVLGPSGRVCIVLAFVCCMGPIKQIYHLRIIVNSVGFRTYRHYAWLEIGNKESVPLLPRDP